MDLGPIYTKGKSFRARAEERQRHFRADKGWAHGKYGHFLDQQGVDDRANLLTDAARKAFEGRMDRGKGVGVERTLGNMLSSQAMCFNVFGTLQETDGGLVLLAKVLTGMGLPVEQVDSIGIEYTPDANVFKDQTKTTGVDCDVLVRFRSPGGIAGVLVIETKFVETEFSRCGFRKKSKSDPRRCPEGTVAGGDGSGCRYKSEKGFLYWERTRQGSTLKQEVPDGPCPFGDYKWQLWVNHALAHALRDKPGDLAFYAVCAPLGNTALLGKGDPSPKLEEFRALVDEAATVRFLPVEDLIEQFDSDASAVFPDREGWLRGLRARYIVPA